MRGSRILLLTAALLVALTLPSASVSGANRLAEKFVARLKSTACTHSGDFFDHGAVFTDAWIRENRRNGTNYMVLRGSFQRRAGAAWHTLVGFGPYTSATFKDDASSHTFSQPFSWAIRDEDVGSDFRWRVRFQWWDKRKGQDIKLAEKVRLSNPCAA